MCRIVTMTFLYFGYGSNLLHQRLLLQNPSAKFVSIGRLQDYALTFKSLVSVGKSRWRGAVASIEARAGDEVWGCVWQLDQQHMATLDKQERAYNPITVKVNSPDEQLYTCRTYQLQSQFLNVPHDNRPSPMYMDVIIRGAEQNKLPPDYLEKLRSVETTGEWTSCDVYQKTLELLNCEGNS